MVEIEKDRKILVFGSYWMGENDIVSLMIRGLKECEFVEQLIHVDPKLYSRSLETRKWVTKKGAIHWINGPKLLALVESRGVTDVVCCAGGLAFDQETSSALKAMGVNTIGIALSDPDDFFVRSKYFANLFDRFFTNAVESIGRYKEIGVCAELLSFAADPSFHKPLGVSTQWQFDTVVVGGARPDRFELVENLRKRGFSVGTYGSGWKGKLADLAGFGSEVHGLKQVEAINQGLTYLSFPGTIAGFVNVKVGVFEAAACGRCVLVQDFDEINRYFVPDEEIITYKNIDNLVSKLDKLHNYPEVALRIGEAARRRIQKDHSWQIRWHQVFVGI